MIKPLSYYYMHETKQVWKSCDPSQVHKVRETQRPRYFTWASSNFDVDQSAATYQTHFIPIDVDFPDISQAIKSVSESAMTLRQKIGTDIKFCRLYATGKKGFHIEIPAGLLGSTYLEDERLPKVAGRFVQKFKIEGTDTSIYAIGRGKMWREANVQRENLAFKVPLQWEELESMTPEIYAELTRQPRYDIVYPVTESANRVLVAMWNESVCEDEAAELARLKRISELKDSEPDTGAMFLLRVRCALNWLAANHASDFEGYEPWKRILLALHVVNMEAEARAFSEAVPGWDRRGFEQQWEAIDDNASELLSPGTIIFEARQRGWRECEVKETLLPQIQNRLECAKADSGLLLEPEFLEQLTYLDGHHKPDYARTLDHEAFKNRKRMVQAAVRKHAETDAPVKETPLQRVNRVIDKLGAADLLFYSGEFWCYTGSYWMPLESDQAIRKAIHDDFKGMAFTASTVSDMVRLIGTEVFRSDVVFGHRQGDVVAFKNGELHLENGVWVLRNHKRESWLTSTIPHNWDAEARCEKFMCFMHDVFANDPDADDKIRLLLEMIGASLVPNVRFERGLILLGAKGRNGKSTLLHILEFVLGLSNCSHLSISKLGDRFNIAQLRNMHANITGEVSKGEGMPDGMTKMVVSGDLVQAEFKGKDGFSFCPFAKLWIAANHLPSQRDFSPALLRRFEIIEFNCQFIPGVNQKHNIAKDLEREAEGIISASLNAYAVAVTRGNLTIPESSDRRKADWRKYSDPIVAFAEDRLLLRASADSADAYKGEWFTSTTALLEGYEQWAYQTRTPSKMSEKGLRDRLLQFDGVSELRTSDKNGDRKRGYSGVVLQPWKN